MVSKNLRSFGEFGLIDKIAKMTRTDRSVLLGIGDDTAVLKIGGANILFTTDMLIEDKHFRLSEATGFEIGWKALAVNISDIAAMGGLPLHAVVAVGLPQSLNVQFVMKIYEGLRAAARQFHVNIVGGDTNASEKLVISVALIGSCGKRRPVMRSGARSGDVVFVSGALGGSYGSGKHLNFMPRIAESQYLIKNFKINSMIDISDGLSSDIHRLANASRVGAALTQRVIPVARSTGKIEEAFTDGEDFELLFTMSSKEAARLMLAKKPKTLADFHAIGKIVPRKFGIKLLKNNGKEEPLLEKGFDHFRDKS